MSRTTAGAQRITINSRKRATNDRQNNSSPRRRLTSESAVRDKDRTGDPVETIKASPAGCQTWRCFDFGVANYSVGLRLLRTVTENRSESAKFTGRSWQRVW